MENIFRAEYDTVWAAWEYKLYTCTEQQFFWGTSAFCEEYNRNQDSKEYPVNSAIVEIVLKAMKLQMSP